MESAYAALADSDPDRRVLLLHSARRDDTRRIAIVRGLLHSTSVVPVPLQLPLTGISALASWFAALSAREVTAGTALAHLRQIRMHLPTYAVTRSVAGLDLPQVKLRHHMLSWLPGTTFAVALDERTRVESTSVRPESTAVRGAVDIVRAGDHRLAAKVQSTVPAAVGETVDLPLPERGAPWWGTSRFYEHCVVPRDVDAFAESLAAAPKRRCPQCGDDLETYCPFCRAQESVLV